MTAARGAATAAQGPWSMRETMERAGADAGTLGEVAALVAHDLNNTLAAIAGFVPLLGTVSDKPEKVTQYAGFLGASAWEAQYIAGQLQDLARLLRAGKEGFGAAGRVDPHAALQQAARAVSQAALATGDARRVDVQPPTGASCFVAADAVLLGRALTDLLLAAWRNAPGRSVLAARVETAPAGVVISVSGPGPALPAETTAAIFTVAGLVALTRRGQRFGVGLGLVRAAAVAEAFGGRARAVSPAADGAGVRLELHLPSPDLPRG